MRHAVELDLDAVEAVCLMNDVHLLPGVRHNGDSSKHGRIDQLEFAAAVDAVDGN